MKSKLLAALAAIVSLCQIQHADAVSISFSSGALDFGTVPVGTASSPITVTAIGTPDSGFVITGWVVVAFNPFSANPPPAPPADNCGASTTCIFSFVFAPTIVGGPQNSNAQFGFLEQNNDTGGVEGSGAFLLPLTGIGTEATPLPAALPLFATGLAALGLFGWRRNRRHGRPGRRLGSC
jgi:hypothetical protein